MRKMKHFEIVFLIACLLFAGCRHQEAENGEDSTSVDTIAQFVTYRLEGEQCLVYINPYLEDDDEPLQVKNSYSVVWPADGLMTDKALRELMICYFGESNTTNVESASQQWLNNLWIFDNPDAKGKTVNAIDETKDYSFASVKSECRQDSNIATFIIYDESYGAGAVHGLYARSYLQVDIESGEVIHLTDLIDTTALGEVIVRAVEDLAVNKEVLENIYGDYKETGKLPVPPDFYIDSTRSNITLVYQIYHIAPFASGIQEVVLPIFWLSKHIPLTPYAKRIFGPGCSID